MFVRVKPAGRHRCLQIAQNYREGKKVKQKILCTLGRVEELTASGKLDSLAGSLLRFSEKLTVLNLHKQGALEGGEDVSIGPALVFERLLSCFRWNWNFPSVEITLYHYGGNHDQEQKDVPYT